MRGNAAAAGLSVAKENAQAAAHGTGKARPTLRLRILWMDRLDGKSLVRLRRGNWLQARGRGGVRVDLANVPHREHWLLG
jgi:hypothetical protein